MDIVLEGLDTYLFDHVYAALLPKRQAPYDYPDYLHANATTQTFSIWQYKPATSFVSFPPTQAAYMSAWDRDNVYRQYCSLFLITWLFGLVVYYIFAGLSYLVVFDKSTMQHPRFLKHQIWLEMKQANEALFLMAFMTAPIFVAEVRGYSKLYDSTADGPGRWFDVAQFPLFLVFTDFCIYWIHRGLHHPLVYKRLHKPHHRWIMPTPFASHAFHPLDGYLQGLPYHLFCFLFPLQKLASVVLFVVVNIWTILIHDGEFYSDNAIINGAACHSVHHLAFNYNYGQYTTLWDRLGGSYRRPEKAMFQKQEKIRQAQWEKDIRVMETILQEVEGVDDREYEPELDTKKTK